MPKTSTLAGSATRVAEHAGALNLGFLGATHGPGTPQGEGEQEGEEFFYLVLPYTTASVTGTTRRGGGKRDTR